MTTSRSRSDALAALERAPFDVLVVGGGINGAVSAAALAARGARVALVDRGDFAGLTSSHSSNLAWGGIKYMETLEFGLVRKLCRSRNELMRAFPSAVQEIRFFTAVTKGSRYHRWVLYLGALLYWVIGSFFTRRPTVLSNADIDREEPAIDTSRTAGGIEYSDAYFVDGDAHFVFRFVRDAVDQGAVALNYVESLASVRGDQGWTTRMRDCVTGRELVVRSSVVVNACGPLAEAYNGRCQVRTRHRHVFSKGVHLVVDRVPQKLRVLTFFATDGRMFFVLPLGHRSSIGTTDTRVDTLPAVVTTDDRSFILSNINARMARGRPLAEDDVISERCGVRPLVVSSTDGAHREDEWTQLSRKHVLEVDRDRAHVSIFGGKLTDCLNVGSEVCQAVESLGLQLSPLRSAWYGESGPDAREATLGRARALGLGPRSGEPEDLARRLWRRYGSRCSALLDAIEADPSLAEVAIPQSGILWAEVVHASRHEMVVCLEDFLRRRTLAEQLLGENTLRASPHLRRVSCTLFGAEDGARQLAAYQKGKRRDAVEPGHVAPGSVMT